MKDEELNRKLENVKLPRIELQSHRRRLRMALLDTDYLKERRKVTVLGLAKSKVKGVIDTMIRGLVSRQPVWKTAVVSILALALVLGLSLTIPSLSEQSVYAQAAEIAENSPEIKAALGGGEVQLVKGVRFFDDKAEVILRGEMGSMLTVQVSLDNEEVTKIETVSLPELTEAEISEAIQIAEADPRVQELLSRGASIRKVFPTYYLEARTNLETDETVVSRELAQVQVVIELGNEYWTVHVDLAQDKVVSLVEAVSGGPYFRIEEHTME